MKIVVTGGLGFIGIELARKLLAAHHEVTLLDNLSVQIHGDMPTVCIPDGAKVVRMDICDLADRPELIDGVDAVFHLAAETGTAQSMYQMSHYTRVNCDGTAALLEAIAKCIRRPKQVVLASSRSVYGEGGYTLTDAQGPLAPAVARTREDLEAGRWEPVDALGRALSVVPTPESLAFAPGSVYAATKASQELLLSSASIALGLRTTIFRFQNVYGEGQSLRNPYTGIISIFFNRARQGLEIPVYEDEDGEIEYGGSTESKYKATFNAEFVKRVYLEGRVGETFKGLDKHQSYFWDFAAGDQSDIELAHWSYFENWDSYRNYLVAKEFCGLEERSAQNTGTYTNFAQNDNLLYDLHTYLMYLKFGFGRGTQDVGIDIRRGALTRDQGIELVSLYDNHFPEEYLSQYLEYYQMTEAEFFDVLDRHVNKSLFRKEGRLWQPTFDIS